MPDGVVDEDALILPAIELADHISALTVQAGLEGQLPPGRTHRIRVRPPVPATCRGSPTGIRDYQEDRAMRDRAAPGSHFGSRVVACG